jgi:curved DNA-binding protein CbpA
VSIPDPYKVLQVDPEAEDEVIEAAYKRLARKYHPDVSPDPDSVARMVRINQAWEMLRDPIRRAAVDRARVRAAGTSARVVAADGMTRAAAQPPGTPPAPRPAGSTAGRPERQGWPFPGMQDPTKGSFSAPPRAAGATGAAGPGAPGAADSGYGTRSMGRGAAGPPPGNPSGSIVSFGRYEGWTLGEIARSDLEYLEWLARMPIGRTWQSEIEELLRQHGRRIATRDPDGPRRGLFRRRR